MQHPNLLDQQIDNLRTLQQSYDAIAGAAEAYNTGKVELAQNITAKGVQASPTETLPELADKVSAIAQQPIILSPSEVGDMYAKQLYGSITTPNYWNLYEVLVQLLNDGRLINYGGILLAEYYRGYDSLALSGAGAGGAYVVSDKDENGQFKMYTEDTTHTWATEFDGKGNRWVAYCFADEYHDFQITDTNTSPRSIFIGRKVGTIKQLQASRIGSIIIPDGNTLRCFDANGYASNFSSNLILRNVENQNKIVLAVSNAVTEKAYFDINTLDATLIGALQEKLSSVILKVKNCGTNACVLPGAGTFSYLGNMQIDGIESGTLRIIPHGATTRLPILKDLIVTNTEAVEFIFTPDAASQIYNLKHIYLGYKINDKAKTISIRVTDAYARTDIQDIELQQGWCKPLYIPTCIELVEDGITNNITEHILKRLKQDEEDCGDGVTITLGATNLAKLTSQESIDLLDLLTNTYGYTFA